MRSTTRIIRLGRMRSPHRIPILNRLFQLILIFYCGLLQPLDLNLPVLVLQHLQSLFVIHEIQYLLPVDFIKADRDLRIERLILFSGKAENIFDQEILDSFHSESFPRACLAIGKESACSFVEDVF